MRAPTTEFRDALAKYRQSLIDDNPGNHPQLKLAAKILDRRRQDPDAEKIWKTVQERTRAEHMLTAEEFIWLILDQRFLAENLQRVVDELPRLEKKVVAGRQRHQKVKDHTAIGVESALLGRTMKLRRQALTRERTAPRQKFMRDLSAVFYRVCGQPLDEVVAALTGIAFDKVIGAQAVRAARRYKSPAN